MTRMNWDRAKGRTFGSGMIVVGGQRRSCSRGHKWTPWLKPMLVESITRRCRRCGRVQDRRPGSREYEAFMRSVRRGGQRLPSRDRVLSGGPGAREIALDAVTAYRGQNEFMRRLQRLARADARWLPSLRQAAVVVEILGEEEAKG